MCNHRFNSCDFFFVLTLVIPLKFLNNYDF